MLAIGDILEARKDEIAAWIVREVGGTQVKAALAVDFHQTAADGSVTLEPVYCLGLCACAPAAMLDGEVIGRLDADTVAEITAEVRT